MSGFIETLVAFKIHPWAENEEQDDQKEQKKMMVGDEKHEENTVLKPDNALDLGPNFCLTDRPHKDKGGKRTPSRKQPILERLHIPVAPEAEMISREQQDVRMVGISIVCPGRPEIVLSQPFRSSPKACLFTLKEGTKYRLKFSFTVSNKVVSGLKYENTLWKAGIRVDKSTVMLGTYSPQEKPYGFQLEEETLPRGVLVRGLYSARTKVMDNEGKCYMDIHYYFSIQKTWPSIS